VTSRKVTVPHLRLLKSGDRPVFDPPGCRCPGCAARQRIPLDWADPGQLLQLFEGDAWNNTGADFKKEPGPGGVLRVLVVRDFSGPARDWAAFRDDPAWRPFADGWEIADGQARALLPASRDDVGMPPGGPGRLCGPVFRAADPASLITCSPAWMTGRRAAARCTGR
jgi:hypothetical protein